MKVYLIDGTYELFRHYHALPKMQNHAGQEVGAVRGVTSSLRRMLKEGATHIGIATDHVIRSFRNDLWPAYKTGDGVQPDLLDQFPLLEEALVAMGFVVWPMIEYEADDALASAAGIAATDMTVDQVIICTPDKDLAQCVRGKRVVQLDRRKRETRDESGVIAKFGVHPESIPDYLALVGDSADGFPGLPGWGAKSSSSLLGRYIHLEHIPKDPRQWQVNVTGSQSLAQTLNNHWTDALLFRDLATLRVEIPLFETVDVLRWTQSHEDVSALDLILSSR